MGQINKGILGGFSGKVGTVVGANWRGIDVMRSLPKKSDRNPTDNQLSVRLKFTLIAQFLAPLRTLIARFFGQPQGYKSRRNLATAYHINNAVTGAFPDYTLKFTGIVVTKGDLIPPQEPVATPQAGETLALVWEDNSGQALAAADDGLIVVVYNESRRLFQTIEHAAMRSDLAYTMQLPDLWADERVHAWIAFANAAGTKCSTSLYLGEITLL